MRFRPLGSTGEQVSVIGFGASPLGDVFGDVSWKQADDAVHSAMDGGVNLFDVSPYYGSTLAEERLGRALVGRRSQIMLSTKCGRYGHDRFDFSGATIVREFEQSLLRLETDYVDLLLAHDIEFAPPEQIMTETLPAMRVLQQQGKVRFIGITGYWPGMLANVAEKAIPQVVLNYCHSNLLINDMDRVLTPVAQRLGLGLVNASPLHMGLLGGEPPPPWHPAPAAVLDAASDVVALCRRFSVDPAALSLHVCLGHPVVASTLVGLKSRTQVEIALQALELRVPAELMSLIEQRIAPVRNTTWPSGRLTTDQWDEVTHAD